MRWHAPLRIAVLAGLWWLLSGGDPMSWVIGVPAVLGAYWALRRSGTADATRPNLLGLARFVPFFLWESLRGGVDVALRTLAPRLRIQPGFYSYQTRLGQGRARLLFANCVSLLPGTLSADLREDRLQVHLLDASCDPLQELRGLERAVGRVYGDPLTHRGRAENA